ncbi:hypothetical protein ALI22I_20920 [Saccharothrix sp. ALI-22-I]|nr:hypothetical protein ALI22I_20920 [Saccharothrix sp. ALI-22-I]
MRQENLPTGLIHALIERQVGISPDAEAFHSGTTAVTYRELEARANRLARFLLARGLRREDRVGVFLDRGPDLVVTLLAVLKAGGCYVPLDPDYPAERVAYMADDSSARLIVTAEHLRGRVPETGAEVVCPTPGDLAGLSDAPPEVGGEPGDLAYLIYTSGSTGRPKGTAIEHRSAVALLHWVREAFTARELDGVLAATSVCFDLSVFEIFGPLAWGGRFILVRNVLELGATRGVRLVNTVPSAMEELIAAGEVPDGVETVCLAGEPLTEALAKRVWQLPSTRRLLNLYGPSEDTTYSTWAEVPADHSGPPPIGRPLPHTTAYVLDESRRPVPEGEVGELYLAGAGLARGYLGRPEETEARFLPDPSVPGGRVYRTGDRVRLRPDGQLEFLGRLDDQVKVRGYRIELGEVTAALVACDGVRNAAASVVHDPSGHPRLVGYVLGDTVDGVLDRLRERLPAHLVPSVLVRVDRLPTTPSGKVDRAALPPPPWHAGEDADAGGDSVDAAVTRVWREVLGDPGSDFFTLNGDSLQATRIVTRLRAELGVTLPLTAVFDLPSVAELAAAVRGAPTAGARVAPAPEAGPHPLTSAQQRLWFLRRLRPDDASYLGVFRIGIDGPLDVPLLVEALGDVVARHDALRTSYHFEDDEPVQRVHHRVPISLRPAGAGPIDLTLPPPARFSLDGDVLVAEVEHIAFDAWSFGVFVRELGRCYEARLAGRRPTARPLPSSVEIASRQRRWLDSPDGRAALDELAGRVADAPRLLRLPTDLPRPAEAGTAGGHLLETLDDDLGRQVAAFARQHRVSTYMVGLAAFAALVASWSGQEDLVIGSAFSGRTSTDSEDVIGCFVNTVPLRLTVTPGTSFRELLAAVREEALFALAHQDVPFERVVERLRVPRTLAHNPLVQVAFGVQNAGRAEYRGDVVALDGAEVESGHARLDLTLWLEERPHGLTALWTYRTDLFHHHTATSLHRRYAALLRRVVTQPDRPTSDIHGELMPEDKPTAPVIRRRSASRSLVSVRQDWRDTTLPALVMANAPGADLAAWVKDNRDRIDELAHHGAAVLFRGFEVREPADFRAVMSALSDDVLDYGERSSPRSRVSSGVYTSTEHPPDQPIVLHNEQSYTLNWPVRIVFFCQTPPTSGGRTPLADSRRVLAALTPSTVDKFEQLGVSYVRNYLPGISLPWQEAFQTEHREGVERHCLDNDIEFEWIDDEHLRTRQRRDAVHRHPVTGERTWFNHALFFHVSSLPGEVAEGLRAALPDEHLPYNTYYGDGSPIEEDVLAELRAAYQAETTSFDWERGDVLLVENMLAAHAREAFEGPRRILAAMSDPIKKAVLDR